MRSRYKYLAIVILCGFFAPFCISDDDNCGPFGPSYIDIEGIMLDNVEDGFVTFQSDLSQDATLHNFRRSEDVILQLGYVVSYLSERRFQTSTLSQFLSPQLLACSPAIGGDGSKEERHAGLTITTIYDHSADFPVGTVLNDKVFVGGFQSRVINSPLDSLLRDTSLIQDFGLSLKIPAPSLADTMQLKIELNLDTGEAYELLTPKLVYTQ